MKLHEKKISELDIFELGEDDSLHAILIHDLKEWAIAVVKENRKEIKILQEKQEEMVYPSDEERIVSVNIATLNGQSILLKDRFELTEEELK